MSSAFDTINRKKLLDVLTTFLDHDSIKMIRFLLSDTKLTINLGEQSKTIPTIIGTPQGDSLSPVLFVVYLEAALRELRPKIKTENSPSPFELAYADDVDFIFPNEEEASSKINTISASLNEWNLKVNCTKTEITTVCRDSDSWKKTRKLGSLLDTREDITRRKTLATVAFNKMYTLWVRRNMISEKRLLLLYNTLVLPILLYNCGTWGVCKKDLDSLDTFHRKQLRRLLGISWEDKVSTEELYRRCDCGPISIHIKNSRRRLLGHILRLDPETPAQVAMTTYFRDGGTKHRGRPPTNLPNTIEKDIQSFNFPNLTLLADHTYAIPTAYKELKCNKHLDSLRSSAQNKDIWKEIIKDQSQRTMGTAKVDNGQAN